jgi:hypothetical protein
VLVELTAAYKPTTSPCRGRSHTDRRPRRDLLLEARDVRYVWDKVKSWITAPWLLLYVFTTMGRWILDLLANTWSFHAVNMSTSDSILPVFSRETRVCCTSKCHFRRKTRCYLRQRHRREGRRITAASDERAGLSCFGQGFVVIIMMLCCGSRVICCLRLLWDRAVFSCAVGVKGCWRCTWEVYINEMFSRVKSEVLDDN